MHNFADIDIAISFLDLLSKGKGLDLKLEIALNEVDKPKMCHYGRTIVRELHI